MIKSLPKMIPDETISTTLPNAPLKRANILYISYTGLTEPLGQSQILQYLIHLASDRQFTLLSFEKRSNWADVNLRQRLIEVTKSAGVKWIPLRYHKRLPALATAFDLLQGLLICLYIVPSRKIDIIHARGYVSSVLALASKKLFRVNYIFDMRGFWADEKIDGGLWAKDSALYRITKWFERKFLTNADVIVSLTHAGVAEMRSYEYLQGRARNFQVIPTCTNLQIFRNENNERSADGSSAPDDEFLLGYVGTATLWYLFEPVLDVFAILMKLRPRARLLILNRDLGEHEYILSSLEAHSIPRQRLELKAVAHHEVAMEMQKMHASAFFIKPTFSKKASAPTKLGELLACGIPCLTNAGVGDVDMILEGEGVGVVVRDLSAQSLQDGVEQLLGLVREPKIMQRCRVTAEKHFSLEQGVRAYSRIYESLMANRPRSQNSLNY